MKIFRKLFILLFVGVIFLSFNTCTEDNPVYEKVIWLGPTDNGNLKVFVRYFNTYFQGATVQIFLSNADRTVGNVYQEAGTTDHGGGPSGLYALFYNLTYQKYYIRATFNDSGTGDFYLGQEDLGAGVWVPKGTTTDIHIMTQKN